MANNGRRRPYIYPSGNCLFWIYLIAILPAISISDEVPLDKGIKSVPPTQQVTKLLTDAVCVPSAEFGEIHQSSVTFHCLICQLFLFRKR